MLINGYGDDSSDETGQRVFALASIIAPEEVWVPLEQAWVDRNERIPFHATDLANGHGDYRGMQKPERDSLYIDLVNMLANSGAFGFGVAVDLAAHREFFPGVNPQMSYHWCFSRVVQHLGEFVKKRGATEIKFSFDNRLDVRFNAANAYKLLIEDESIPYRHIFNGELSFLCSKKHPRIQVGDLYVYECMKHLDNMVGPAKRRERKSMMVLTSTNRFGGDFFMREYFEDKRRKWDEIQKGAGFTFDDYEEWRSKNKVLNNISNQFAFLAWLSVQDKK